MALLIGDYFKANKIMKMKEQSRLKQLVEFGRKFWESIPSRKDLSEPGMRAFKVSEPIPIGDARSLGWSTIDKQINDLNKVLRLGAYVTDFDEYVKKIEVSLREEIGHEAKGTIDRRLL